MPRLTTHTGGWYEVVPLLPPVVKLVDGKLSFNCLRLSAVTHGKCQPAIMHILKQQHVFCGWWKLAVIETVECSKWHSNATGKVENKRRLIIKKKTL